MDPTTTFVFSRDTMLPVTLNSDGQEYVLIRCNQCKNTLDNVKQDTLPQFSNLMAVVPSPGTGYIQYDVPHTGNKIQLNGRNLDNITLLFQDKWGQPLFGIRDFFVELTVDFLKLGDLKEKSSMMQLKRDS